MRRSPILKVGKSPGRCALQDLNVNPLQVGEMAKKKPHRRVSFAETLEVKEFHTDFSTLSFWNKCDDKMDESETTTSTEDSSKAAIEGLENLLNGQIHSKAALLNKFASQDQNSSESLSRKRKNSECEEQRKVILYENTSYTENKTEISKENFTQSLESDRKIENNSRYILKANSVLLLEESMSLTTMNDSTFISSNAQEKQNQNKTIYDQSQMDETCMLNSNDNVLKFYSNIPNKTLYFENEQDDMKLTFCNDISVTDKTGTLNGTDKIKPSHHEPVNETVYFQDGEMHMDLTCYNENSVMEIGEKDALNDDEPSLGDDSCSILSNKTIYFKDGLADVEETFCNNETAADKMCILNEENVQKSLPVFPNNTLYFQDQHADVELTYCKNRTMMDMTSVSDNKESVKNQEFPLPHPNKTLYFQDEQADISVTCSNIYPTKEEPFKLNNDENSLYSTHVQSNKTIYFQSGEANMDFESCNDKENTIMAGVEIEKEQTSSEGILEGKNELLHSLKIASELGKADQSVYLKTNKSDLNEDVSSNSLLCNESVLNSPNTYNSYKDDPVQPEHNHEVSCNQNKQLTMQPLCFDYSHEEKMQSTSTVSLTKDLTRNNLVYDKFLVNDSTVCEPGNDISLQPEYGLEKKNKFSLQPSPINFPSEGNKQSDDHDLLSKDVAENRSIQQQSNVTERLNSFLKADCSAAKDSSIYENHISDSTKKDETKLDEIKDDLVVNTQNSCENSAPLDIPTNTSFTIEDNDFSFFMETMKKKGIKKPSMTSKELISYFIGTESKRASNFSEYSLASNLSKKQLNAIDSQISPECMTDKHFHLSKSVNLESCKDTSIIDAQEHDTDHNCDLKEALDHQNRVLFNNEVNQETEDEIRKTALQNLKDAEKEVSQTTFNVISDVKHPPKKVYDIRSSLISLLKIASRTLTTAQKVKQELSEKISEYPSIEDITKLEAVENKLLERKENLKIYERHEKDILRELELQQYQTSVIKTQIESTELIIEEKKFNMMAKDLQEANCEEKIKRILKCIEADLEEYCDERLVLSFAWKTIYFEIYFGDHVAEAKTFNSNSSRHIKSASLYPKQTPTKPMGKLVHEMILESVDPVPKYSSELYKIINSISTRTRRGKQLAKEVDKISLYHPIEIKENRITVEFSHMKAHSMFYLTFEIDTKEYPNASIIPMFDNKIGKISKDTLLRRLAFVLPGGLYISKLVEEVNIFLEEQGQITNNAL